MRPDEARLAQQHPGDHEPRYDEEDVDADESARQHRDPGVIQHDQRHGHSPEPFDVGPEEPVPRGCARLVARAEEAVGASRHRLSGGHCASCGPARDGRWSTPGIEAPVDRRSARYARRSNSVPQAPHHLVVGATSPSQDPPRTCATDRSPGVRRLLVALHPGEHRCAPGAGSATATGQGCNRGPAHLLNPFDTSARSARGPHDGPRQATQRSPPHPCTPSTSASGRAGRGLKSGDIALDLPMGRPTAQRSSFWARTPSR